MVDLIARMNVPSDNFIAETLIKAMGMTFSQSGTTAAGAVARPLHGGHARRAHLRGRRLRPLALEPDVPARGRLAADGDGGGRAVRAVRRARCRSRAAAAPCTTGCAAARRATRAVPRPARCRNVSGLAGYCQTRDGGYVAFAFLMNGVYPTGARRLQDRMAAALARYDG